MSKSTTTTETFDQAWLSREMIEENLTEARTALKEALQCQVDAVDISRQDHHDSTTADVARAMAAVSRALREVHELNRLAEAEQVAA